MRVLASGVGCFGIAYLGFALVEPSIATLAVLFVVAGIGIGFVETAEHAAVAEQAPVDPRSALWPQFNPSGTLRQRCRPRAAFIYFPAWMLVSLVSLAITTNRERSE